MIYLKCTLDISLMLGLKNVSEYLCVMGSDWQRKLNRELKNEALKEYEGWSHNELVETIIQLRGENADLEEQLTSKDTSGAEEGQNSELNESMFRQEWSYVTKIHFLLALHQKPLTSREIDGYLSKLDSHYKDYTTPQYNLYVHLSRAARSGRIKKIKLAGIKILWFALPEWMDENNELKREFLNYLKLFK